MKKNVSFRIMLTFAILLMALVPLLSISAYYYQSTRYMLIKNRQNELSSSVSVANSLYDMSCGKYMNVNSISAISMATFDSLPYKKFSRVFANGEQNEKAALFSRWRRVVNQELNQIKQKTALLDGDYSMYMYFPKERVLFDSNATFYEHVSGNAFQQVFPAAEINETASWCSIHKISYYKEKTDTLIMLPATYISSVSLLQNEETHIAEAITLVNFDPNIFSRISYVDENNSDGSVLLFRQDGDCLIGDAAFSAQDIGKIRATIVDANHLQRDELTLGNESYVFEAAKLGEEFLLVELFPIRMIIQDLDNRIRKVFVASAIIAVVFAFIAFNLAQHFYRPLKKLSDNIAYVRNGDLTKRIQHNRTDEYGRVFDCYNEMLDKINDLIENNTNEKLLRTEAELFLLQERINPHFIYNSLEIIYSLAKLNRTEEIPRITKALSDFFRMCLSDGSVDVPLKTALDICEKYLIIQNTRFHGKISYTVSVEDDLQYCLVPKYAIQVLVENAVVHGIEPLLHQGSIDICVSERDSKLLISVVDNGIGVSMGKIEEINHQIRNPKVGTGNYALKNLNRQIVMRYGEGYGVLLSQPQNSGTQAEITLPRIKGE